MSNPPRDEKQEEKQREKDEKNRSDPLSTAVWGAIIIWAGLVLLLDNMGLLSNLGFGRGIEVPGALPVRVESWGLIFTGAGVLLLIEVAVRLLMPVYRRHVIGSTILALVFLGIGLGNLVNWGVIWALVLIGLGVIVLVRALMGRSS